LVHRALVAAEFPPRKRNRNESMVVECIRGLGQVHSERFVAGKMAICGNQDLNEIGIRPQETDPGRRKL
jgi:hypothetical protein